MPISDYQVVLGLEVHAQLLTRTKIFCGCSTAFGAEPNTHTCPICLGLPGVLPALNREVVEMAVRTGLALGCAIQPRSVFARKNYFYPDLPKGYQISQYELPICVGGGVEIAVDGAEKRIRLVRIHMEEDAGKNVHDVSPDGASGVDLNRAGVPLLEIVSEPDLRSVDEAIEYLKTLRAILMTLDVNDGNLQEGSFRCDANVSIMPRGSTKLGTRCEIKNMNSFRFLRQAIDYEVRRQVELVEAGRQVEQETRLFDPERGETRSMRSKEEAHDYRYFPDPDLLPLELDEAFVASLAADLPELPDAKRARFMADYGLSAYDASILVAERETADFFESALKHGDGKRDPKAVANWLMGDVAAQANAQGVAVADAGLSAAALAGLVDLIGEGVISGKIAKDLLARLFADDRGADPRALVEARGLRQVTDAGAIDSAVDAVIAANPDKAEQARTKPGMLGWFVGQVMKSTSGKANPQAVSEALKKRLGI